MSSYPNGPSNECKCSGNNNLRVVYEMDNETDTVIFQYNGLFSNAFLDMEAIRRQGRLCDVVLKVTEL